MRTLVATFGRSIAAFVMLAMLTSSIAMAAYVCPKFAGELVAMSDMVMTAQMSGMDEQQPAQCAERHSGDKQALEQSGSAPALALPAVISVQLLSPTILPAWQVLAVLASPTTFSSHARPFLRTQRLRI